MCIDTRIHRVEEGMTDASADDDKNDGESPQIDIIYIREENIKSINKFYFNFIADNYITINYICAHLLT